MKKAELYFNVLRLPVDFLMLVAAGVTSYFLRTKLISAYRPVLFELNLPLYRYLYLVVFVALVFVGAYAVSGLYSLKSRRGAFDELMKILVASSAGIMIVIIYIFLRQELFDSRFLVLGSWFLAVIFVFTGRLLVSAFQRYYVARKNFGVHHVVVIGGDELASAVAEKFSHNPAAGYRLLKKIPAIDLAEIRSLIAQRKLDEVLLADPNQAGDQVQELVDLCHENHVVFKYIPNIHRTLTANFDIDVIDGVPFIELKRTNLDGWGKVAKRTADILFSLVGMILLIPIWIIVPIAIKLDSPGPVFVKLRRVSRNREFGLYKFRSMVQNAEAMKSELMAKNERHDGPLFKIKNDPRVTRVGRFIRRYRIDELPQFWNVLKGDMSLVGPRPHQPDEIARYQKHHKKVLAIKAGATGLAQVSGSSDLAFEREVGIDTFYVENWSLLLDIRIILKTVVRIFTDKTAV